MKSLLLQSPSIRLVSVFVSRCIQSWRFLCRHFLPIVLLSASEWVMSYKFSWSLPTIPPLELYLANVSQMLQSHD
jgi:hypothetical protein